MREPVAVLGVGMHPWGKWGRPFTEYGATAVRNALTDAGLAWRDVDFVAGAASVRSGYPGHVAGATIAHALGWQGADVANVYSACASGSAALDIASTRILAGLADVVLAVGAVTSEAGFLAPNAGERTEDPDWLRFRLLGATNPTYFALYARRRMMLYGTTEREFAAVKVKNSRHASTNPNARYQRTFTEEEVLASPLVADPLRLLDLCTTSDGAAAVVLTSLDYARRLGVTAPVRLAGLSTATPVFPNTLIEMPFLATDSPVAVTAPDRSFRDSLAPRALEQAGLGPGDIDVAEVYDLSSAFELDWYEHLGLCQPGGAERLLHDGVTSIGGRVPVNPSGGLGAFGEAVPAQALAQVCELTWQLRGQAGARQVENPRVGVAANIGLFCHGSAIVLSR